ncbi:very short patch repair endonuclease [Rhizobium ruizarguesonis]
MVDTLTPLERSKRMSLIKSGNTVPELALRKALHRLGFRFRLHNKKLPGKPDIVLPKFKTAIFVHGCFWHRHAGCKVATTPKSNTAFWVEKFDKNVRRDAKVKAELEQLGWDVHTVWECEVSSGKSIANTVLVIADVLRARSHQPTKITSHGEALGSDG